ncbi:MAG: type II toxin-antitoxin system RelE/ParE family toxin, partial [Desulfobacteraceae bacterium]|nr:type II toxin-antitoxin system RelE/ParE family toxin [Desulfobacteraceae bacterium]
MKIEFKKSFAKDLRKKPHEKDLLENIKDIIQKVERAVPIGDIANHKKLKAEGKYYHIRSG